MMIAITIGKNVFRKRCMDVWRWRGSFHGTPDWLEEFLLEDRAIITPSRGVMFKGLRNGYPQADVGDLIVLVKPDVVEIIRQTERTK